MNQKRRLASALIFTMLVFLLTSPAVMAISSSVVISRITLVVEVSTYDGESIYNATTYIKDSDNKTILYTDYTDQQGIAIFSILAGFGTYYAYASYNNVTNQTPIIINERQEIVLILLNTTITPTEPTFPTLPQSIELILLFLLISTMGAFVISSTHKKIPVGLSVLLAITAMVFTVIIYYLVKGEFPGISF